MTNLDIISRDNKRILLTKDQYDMYLNKEIEKFYLPFFKDQYEKTPYISRDVIVFTWEYKVSLSTGIKTKYAISKLDIKIFNNTFPLCVIKNYKIKPEYNGLKFKSFDAIKSTHENGLHMRTNWYWEITL